MLASPHQDSLEQAVSPRSLAAVAASGQRIEEIVAVMPGAQPQSASAHEFAACLLHELVLVADNVEGHPALRPFADTLLAEGHPLAALPLRPLPAEQGFRRPPGAANNWTWMVPPVRANSTGPHVLQITPSMSRRAAAVDITEISIAESAHTMSEAVRHWFNQSNGTVTAQEFWLLEPVAAQDLPAVVERLPLAPGPADEGPAQLYPSSPDLVLRTLLTAATRWSGLRRNPPPRLRTPRRLALTRRSDRLPRRRPPGAGR